MKQVLKRPLAEADLDEIWDYIAEDSPERASNFLRKLYARMQTLATNPNIGRKRDELSYYLDCEVFPMAIMLFSTFL